MTWLLALVPRALGLLTLGNLRHVANFLLSPPGVILCVVLAFAAGGWNGRRTARAECETRIAASVQQARQIDAAAATEAAAQAARDAAANQQLATDLERRIADYAARLQNLPACSLDDRDVDAIGGMQHGRLPEVGPPPPRRR